MFYSKTNPRQDIGIHVGRKEKNTYSMRVDDFGHKELVNTGVTNFYDKIQEQVEDTKIENIIKRATMGDFQALNRNNPLFGDFTNAPTSLADAQNKIIQLENAFEKLPLEIRRAYDHSPEKFIADAGSENFNKLMGIKQPEVETPTVEPTITPGKVEVSDIVG